MEHVIKIPRKSPVGGSLPIASLFTFLHISSLNEEKAEWWLQNSIYSTCVPVTIWWLMMNFGFANSTFMGLSVFFSWCLSFPFTISFQSFQTFSGDDSFLPSLSFLARSTFLLLLLLLLLLLFLHLLSNIFLLSGVTFRFFSNGDRCFPNFPPSLSLSPPPSFPKKRRQKKRKLDAVWPSPLLKALSCLASISILESLALWNSDSLCCFYLFFFFALLLWYLDCVCCSSTVEEIQGVSE